MAGTFGRRARDQGRGRFTFRGWGNKNLKLIDLFKSRKINIRELDFDTSTKFFVFFLRCVDRASGCMSFAINDGGYDLDFDDIPPIIHC